MSYQTVLKKISTVKDYTKSKYLDRDEEAFFKCLKTTPKKSNKK